MASRHLKPSQPDIGRWVRIVALPPRVEDLPRESRRIFVHCLNNTYRVAEVAPHGWLGLDVSQDVDQRFGGTGNEIWLEPECVTEDEPRLNRARGRPALRDAVHIARGGSALNVMGVKVLTVADSLALGPSSIDPVRHLQLRRHFWRRFDQGPYPPGQRRRRSPDLERGIRSAAEVARFVRSRRGRPVVVWAGRDWMDRLFLWWVCDALVRGRVEREEFWIATPTDPDRPRIGMYSPADLVALFPAARPLRAGSVKTGARMWKAYAAPNLRLMMSAFEQGEPAPPLGPISDDYLRMVPTVRAGRTHLAGLDRELLGCLRIDEWRAPIDLLRKGDSADAFMSIMEAYGDMIIGWRLWSWAQVAPTLIEHRIKEGKSPFTWVEYRLTDDGQRMLDGGLDAMTAPPSLDVGGFRSYADGDFWSYLRCERRREVGSTATQRRRRRPKQ